MNRKTTGFILRIAILGILVVIALLMLHDLDHGHNHGELIGKAIPEINLQTYDGSNYTVSFSEVDATLITFWFPG